MALSFDNSSWIKKVFTVRLKNPSYFFSACAFAAILFFSLFLRLNMISCSMPYPGKWDEGLITHSSKRILTKSEFNPDWHGYPSLPVYLTGMAFTAGFLNAASHQEIVHTRDIKSVHYPYYTHSRIVWPARALFAVLSVITLFLLGFLTYKTCPNVWALPLAPLILALSSTYFYYSYHWLNVDILGVFFVGLFYFYQIYHLEKDTIFHKSVIPGILCALVLSCKYNLVWIFVPGILAILLYSKTQKTFKCFLLAPVMVVAFFLLNPFILVDFTRFLNDVAFVVFDYAKGRPFSSVQPGISLFFWFIKEIVRDFGYGTLVLFIIGMMICARDDWKKFLFLISFPVVLLIYMSSLKAYAVRNILTVYMFYVLFTAVGFAQFIQWLNRALCSLPFFQFPTRKRTLTFIVILFLSFILLFPSLNFIKWIQARPDPRTSAVSWIHSHIEKGSTLIIPSELSMDTRSIEKDYQIVHWEFKNLDKETFFNQLKTFKNPHVVMPFFNYHKDRPSHRPLAFRLNNFYQYIEIIKTFPGRYRYETTYEPFAVFSVVKNNTYDLRNLGVFTTGCVFVDNNQLPCVLNGHPEINIGRLKTPIDPSVQISPLSFSIEESLIDLNPDKGFDGVTTQNVHLFKESSNGMILKTKSNDPILRLPDFKPTGEFLPISIKIKMTSPGDTLFQLFYLLNTKKIFSENRSISKKLTKGYNEVHLSLPDKIMTGGFRIDPGQIPGEYIIHGIEIYRDFERYAGFFPSEFNVIK